MEPTMQESLFRPEDLAGGGPADTAAFGLHAVFARFQRSEPFSHSLFDGFERLRVLTYSASIPATVHMLERFDQVECVFGYEGILRNLQDVFACQKMLGDNLLTAVKGLPGLQQRRIVEAIAEDRVHLRVVREQIAHAKIFLLDGAGRRRVMVGSANLSLRALSGGQAETLLVFDEDVDAWAHFEAQYTALREASTTELTLLPITEPELRVEELPLLHPAPSAPSTVTLFVGTEPGEDGGRANIRVVERIAARLTPYMDESLRPRKGHIVLEPKVVGRIVRLIRSHHATTEAAEPTWLSIERESRAVLLSGRDIPLNPGPEEVASDVGCLLEYFANFDRGFCGDVEAHKRNYFTFLSWLYASPFLCDLRNHALREGGYIFDYPQFAILYGRSNCGKTLLVQTLMSSMLGAWEFKEKESFTRSQLRDLLHACRRYPVVFDDVERDRFRSHALEIIKDETLALAEYPPVVLSMNADTQAFPSEVSKRCLMLYTNASVPDEPELTRALSRSTHAIHARLGTALYRAFLVRLMERLDTEDWDGLDLLHLSSTLLHDLFSESIGGATVPGWCAPIRMDDYQGRKHEKVRTELLKLWETNRKVWSVGHEEVVLSIDYVHDARALAKEIPDHILGEGTKAGNIVLRRAELEQFLGRRLSARWWRVHR
jgi:hypothetical protein